MSEGHGRPYALVHRTTGQRRVVVAHNGPQALRHVATDWSCEAASAIDVGLFVSGGGKLEFATGRLAGANAALLDQMARDQRQETES